MYKSQYQIPLLAGLSPNVCPFFLKKSRKVFRTRTAGHCSVDPILAVLWQNSRVLVVGKWNKMGCGFVRKAVEQK